ncbi:hypothetical protein SDC9_166686 [bioreactor metagenome]|uniref:Uncharacterized protein n=1 Tax=bioreactor metagenome TaxID=1076179 RepID=A0A645FXQ2_9ZZZZ
MENDRFGASERRQAGDVGDHAVGDPVDVAHRLADLDVAAFVEILERDREGAERFTPQFVDAFLAATVQHVPAQFHGFQQATAAFAHQRIVAEDLDAAGL